MKLSRTATAMFTTESGAPAVLSRNTPISTCRYASVWYRFRFAASSADSRYGLPRRMPSNRRTVFLEIWAPCALSSGSISMLTSPIRANGPVATVSSTAARRVSVTVEKLSSTSALGYPLSRSRRRSRSRASSVRYLSNGLPVSIGRLRTIDAARRTPSRPVIAIESRIVGCPSAMRNVTATASLPSLFSAVSTATCAYPWLR